MHALTTATTNRQQKRFVKFELQKKDPDKKLKEEGLERLHSALVKSGSLGSKPNRQHWNVACF